MSQDAKGWTRDQAIKYMLDHSGMSRTDATAEVERYIAIPSQATAYKIGALTIQRLRAKAEAELGPKFDIREFHAEVLNTGALPLQILEQKIVPFDRREAMHTVAQAKLDGVPMKFAVCVLKKDGCVYDLAYMAAPARFERGECLRPRSRL